MRTWFQRFIGVIAAGAVLAAVTQAGAQTCALKLKRLETRPTGGSLDYAFRRTSWQHFSMQDGTTHGRWPYDIMVVFSKLVEKEPEYHSKHPLRAVAELGSEQYAFVLDSDRPESESKPVAIEAKTLASDAKAAQEEPARPEPVRYNRLYFDLNHNGDLTDDGVIRALEVAWVHSTDAECSFPRVDLTIDLDGTKVDYAFLLRARSCPSGYVSVFMNAAAYREGEITLDGTLRRVVVLDYNGNGRFDDRFEVRRRIWGPKEGYYFHPGDMVMIDPDPDRHFRFAYDMTDFGDRQPLSKLVNIGDRYWEVEISPAGDKLTLTPSSAPVGYVTSSHEGFNGLVYGDEGIVKLRVEDASQPIPLPQGRWRLVTYTIDRTDYQEKKEKEANEGASLLGTLSNAMIGSKRSPRAPPTQILAQGRWDTHVMNVHADQTASLPFGPPYKPMVQVASGAEGEGVQLEFSLVGAGGERCRRLRVRGVHPREAEFTISTPDGEVVQRGAFKWG